MLGQIIVRNFFSFTRNSIVSDIGIRFKTIFLVLNILYTIKRVLYNVSNNKQELLSSVATKIENGPKMNTKILQFLKMDQSWIQRIFVNSKNLQRLKILRRSSKIENSSNIFEDTKIFKVKWKIFLLKIFLQAATWTNFPSHRT